MDKFSPSHSSLMTRRNTRQQQPSPPSADRSAEGSQNAPQRGNATIPSNRTSQTRRTHRHASQPGVGEEINITLSDENSSVPSQPNSQTALAVPPPTNNSQPVRTPASSQGGSRAQMSQDVKHFFQKTKGMPTICISCK